MWIITFVENEYNYEQALSLARSLELYGFYKHPTRPSIAFVGKRRLWGELNGVLKSHSRVAHARVEEYPPDRRLKDYILVL